MTNSLKLLLVEDSLDDELLLTRHLKKSGYELTLTRVSSTSELEAQLQGSGRFDLVITDHSLPGFQSTDVIAITRSHYPDMPLIVVSGSIGEELAVEALKAGANDYVLKENLTRLGSSIERELREVASHRARRDAEERLHYMAFHDSLTGLFNRFAFERALDQLSKRIGPDDRHTLIFIDLDDFKVVNDCCGHLAGDQLLVQVATLFSQRLPGNFQLCRVGGDEFTILMENTTLNEGLDFANDLQDEIRQFRFNWHNKMFSIGASMGAVEITAALAETNSILSAADMACYSAKDAGRGRVHVYEEQDSSIVTMREQLGWVQIINEAMQQDRFTAYWQPIVNLGQSHDRPAFYEFLMRLEHEGKLIPPGVFIPAAERYHLMNQLDRHMVRLCFRHIEAHQLNRNRCMYFINLSGATLSDALFPDYVAEQMILHSISPENLCFEITETAAVSNFQQACQFIGRLRELGCHFALDDFGAGMSSYGYLKNLPVDFIKIDGSFVRDICEDPMSYAIVESVNRICHVAGLKTIAEFVENETIYNRLVEIGVDYCQGYAIAHPEPVPQINLLASASEAQPARLMS
ncbi:EAL domain-containing protein [Pokkaliibacter sp. MBI-7]|uniref:GGDEF domain-containing response regulator n=1 Tax=Pokkaliibacter sp. MBI-7 TaxID=3040600 RepID=UPI00244AE9A7|nr:GGDEF domain-containing response regulator [Pokkaliibacter sp. MBI-7]MDH2435155.1 EAL domain-containing protein [Pokkaliibacter sp. MBI-7]